MGWTTRELAALAGTTMRAVRHYHQIGLLPLPERLPNGYKSYGTDHLVRMLRITRLTDLGFSLSRIATLIDDEIPVDALRSLDSELAATIARLQRTRDELGQILHGAAPPDIPAPVAPAAARAGLTEADHSLVVVKTRFLDPSRMTAYGETLQELHADPVSGDFDQLPADASTGDRRDVAERMTPLVRGLYEFYPGLEGPPEGRPVASTLLAAMDDLYNPAQIDVMHRIHARVLESA